MEMNIYNSKSNIEKKKERETRRETTFFQFNEERSIFKYFNLSWNS